MAPAARKQPTRSGPAPSASNTTPAQTARQHDAITDFQARRLNRRLEDLERTNPTDIPASSFVPSDSKAKAGAEIGFGGVVVPLAVDKGKKKQSGNVRKILYAKKSLKDWLEELTQYRRTLLPSRPYHPPRPANSARPAAIPARIGVQGVQSGAATGNVWGYMSEMEDVASADELDMTRQESPGPGRHRSTLNNVDIRYGVATCPWTLCA
ncbi:uncharacterized protein MKK02DRAFT_37915 [Dioszegia hungarica]|uniref:Uncharacterized protein n=1 Tax=Dioszegia hungarica TaxID=4972 RepID=A0AA38H7M2_9TREE|nr:uncharacterized protein MKK02DRAFT_37915 [Dioszegia hungarica]KAI9634384.1 hypothetical protein MKK02DRAFT_37915 [Dioszegia hungarica]